MIGYPVRFVVAIFIRCLFSNNLKSSDRKQVYVNVNLKNYKVNHQKES